MNEIEYSEYLLSTEEISKAMKEMFLLLGMPEEKAKIIIEKRETAKIKTNKFQHDLTNKNYHEIKRDNRNKRWIR